jgi:hypothetical protein
MLKQTAHTTRCPWRAYAFRILDSFEHCNNENSRFLSRVSGIRISIRNLLSKVLGLIFLRVIHQLCLFSSIGYVLLNSAVIV